MGFFFSLERVGELMVLNQTGRGQRYVARLRGCFILRRVRTIFSRVCTIIRRRAAQTGQPFRPPTTRHLRTLPLGTLPLATRRAGSNT
jgi:hypothetical protein